MTSFNEAFYEEFLFIEREYAMVDEHFEVETLYILERLDGRFDIGTLWSDGSVHTSIEDVDPMADIPF